ncbi:hypothetical protein E2N92_01405 [Methanofollis formosanus]|uniref:Uncharacterized protein n=1 Tax=Methanofollis formosanus TaxID=299308 RepID=A0A8G1EFJ3_9EURY|nr:hypothetical protein [Methanofollis formosanus]QYZ78181.1 hypothetical protein E2N92_01405 [Methanofollis formosanus]
MSQVRAQAYITLAGRSGWALLNTYHAVLRERGYRPAEVHLVAWEESALGTVLEGIRLISERYAFSPRISVVRVAEGDYAAAGERVLGLVRAFAARGFETALDITPGRKAAIVSVCLDLAAADLRVDHIYYLGLPIPDPPARPYLLIPLHIQPLRDLIEEGGPG